jgi:hypothetical protein
MVSSIPRQGELQVVRYVPAQAGVCPPGPQPPEGDPTAPLAAAPSPLPHPTPPPAPRGWLQAQAHGLLEAISSRAPAGAPAVCARASPVVAAPHTSITAPATSHLPCLGSPTTSAVAGAGPHSVSLIAVPLPGSSRLPLVVSPGLPHPPAGLRFEELRHPQKHRRSWQRCRSRGSRPPSTGSTPSHRARCPCKAMVPRLMAVMTAACRRATSDSWRDTAPATSPSSTLPVLLRRLVEHPRRTQPPFRQPPGNVADRGARGLVAAPTRSPGPSPGRFDPRGLLLEARPQTPRTRGRRKPARSPALLPKWCCTRPGDTSGLPGHVPDRRAERSPGSPNSSRATSRIRARAVRSERRPRAAGRRPRLPGPVAALARRGGPRVPPDPRLSRRPHEERRCTPGRWRLARSETGVLDTCMAYYTVVLGASRFPLGDGVRGAAFLSHKEIVPLLRDRGDGGRERQLNASSKKGRQDSLGAQSRTRPPRPHDPGSAP